MESHADHAHHAHEMPTEGRALNGVAISATLHCLTGCAIGEVTGMVIGTALGFSDLGTIALAVTLAFIFGYSLTSLPLLRAGLAFSAVIPIALASDTLSIATMEVVDNAIMVIVPGAMESGVGDILFWGALSFALAIAFVLTVPVNRWLLKRGKGHTAVHETGIHGGPPTRVVGAATAIAFVFGLTVLVAEVLDDEDSASAAGGSVDSAFAAAMVPHHDGAIEMSELALDRAEHPQLRALAESIIDAQESEIETLSSSYERLAGDGIESADDSAALGTLDLDEHEAGMMHDLGALETAEPFDQEFIEMMIPHHEGAIEMAEVQLDRGTDPELSRLASEIIDAQRAEISRMEDWYQRWYE